MCASTQARRSTPGYSTFFPFRNEVVPRPKRMRTQSFRVGFEEFADVAAAREARSRPRGERKIGREA
eukprot:6867916-Prymnesium_polylepis.1